MNTDLAYMTPAARSMAARIDPDVRVGTLEHWSTSISDGGPSCFAFGDERNDYLVYSDGTVVVEAVDTL